MGRKAGRHGNGLSGKLMPLVVARDRLMIVWFGAAAPSFCAVAALTLRNRYGDDAQAAWAWYLPTTIPTLCLIVGIAVATAFGRADERRVRLVFYRLALGLSVFYLGVIFCIVIGFPLSDQLEPLEMMRRANMFLPALQGLVGGTIGALFTEQARSGQSDAKDTPADCTAPSYKTWKSQRGGFSGRAVFVAIDNGNVMLRKGDGTEVSIPFLHLRKSDQKWVEKHVKHAQEAEATVSVLTAAAPVSEKDGGLVPRIQAPPFAAAPLPQGSVHSSKKSAAPSSEFPHSIPEADA
jgi:hypothetical protein